MFEANFKFKIIMDTYFIKTTKNIESPSLGPFALESFSATQLDADDLILKNGNITWNKASELQELRPFIRKTVIEERSRQTENQQYDRKAPQNIPSLRTPTFTNYIKSKRNLLIIWFLFHGFALFVNVFDIEGYHTYNQRSTKDDIETHYEDSYFNLFTSSDYLTGPKSRDFWPFVKFYESTKSNGSSVNDGAYEMVTTNFYGIFNQYDYSEFIAYSIIIFLVLYLQWNSRYSPSKIT
jgi:hypothetical protein